MARLPGTRPFVVGLTGSIGMGKSETLRIFASFGIPVYDADAAVHRLYEAGGAAVPLIEKAFPGVVRDGRVERAELSRRVIGDSALAARLEAIVHPLIRRDREGFLESAADAEIVVLDIPLLFETGAEAGVDAVVVASAPAHLQRARVLERRGMTPEKFDFLHARQMPDAQKRAKAHFVVVTDKGPDHTRAQVALILDEIRARFGKGADHA